MKNERVCLYINAEYLAFVRSVSAQSKASLSQVVVACVKEYREHVEKNGFVPARIPNGEKEPFQHFFPEESGAWEWITEIAETYGLVPSRIVNEALKFGWEKVVAEARQAGIDPATVLAEKSGEENV